MTKTTITRKIIVLVYTCTLGREGTLDCLLLLLFLKFYNNVSYLLAQQLQGILLNFYWLVYLDTKTIFTHALWEKDLFTIRCPISGNNDNYNISSINNKWFLIIIENIITMVNFHTVQQNSLENFAWFQAIIAFHRLFLLDSPFYIKTFISQFLIHLKLRSHGLHSSSL